MYQERENHLVSYIHYKVVASREHSISIPVPRYLNIIDLKAHSAFYRNKFYTEYMWEELLEFD